MLLKADFFCRKISNCWNELQLLASDSNLTAIWHRACPTQIHPLASWTGMPVLIKGQLISKRLCKVFISPKTNKNIFVFLP